MKIDELVYLHHMMLGFANTQKDLLLASGVLFDDAYCFVKSKAFKNRNLTQLAVDWPEETKILIDYYLDGYRTGKIVSMETYINNLTND